jgi:putative ABC transport system permease protein
MMISAQFAKIISDVLSSKTRTLLIVISIMAGLTAVGTILSARTLLSQSVDKSFSAVNYASGSIVTYQAFDKDFVASFEDNQLGFSAVDARRTLNTRVVNNANQKTNITLYSLVDYQNSRVNKISPQSGQYPPPRHQILIESSSLAVYGVKEGDTLQIETSDKKLRSLKIAGSVMDISSPPAAFAGTGYGYVDAETLEWLGAPAGFNELLFTVQKEEGKPKDIGPFLDKMTERVEDAGYSVANSQIVSEIPINSMIQVLLLVLGSIGTLSLVLSIFLIINSISAMVAQQTRLIGVMKAIGGRASQIMGMYLSVSLFYGLIALCFSIPLSILASNALSEFMASSFNFTIQGERVQASSIVVQVILGVLVPTLSSLFPLINGLRISATQALSSGGTNQVNFGANLIDRLFSGTNLWFARNILMRPFLLALRNMFRQKIRLLLTLITLILAGSIFITIFNLRETIFASMNRMTQMQSYDLEVNFSRPYRFDELQQTLQQINGIHAIDTWITTPSKRQRPDNTESKNILLTGLHLKSEVVSAPVILEGRWLTPEDQNALIITSSLANDEPDIKIGQVISLKINDRSYPFQVVGKALGMAQGLSGNTAYVNYDYLSNLLNNKTRTNTVLIMLDETAGLTAADFKNSLDTQLKQSGFYIASIQTTTEMRASMESNFGTVLVLLVLMALLLAIVGGLGLMGTMSINVIERTREIGVLRAIGSPNAGVNVVFMTEGLSIGILSCLFSIPASFPITHIVANAIGTLVSGAPWTGSFTSSGVFIWIVLVLILSLLANYFPARSATRLTVREVLAYD